MFLDKSTGNFAVNSKGIFVWGVSRGFLSRVSAQEVFVCGVEGDCLDTGLKIRQVGTNF